jgi:hypothetical protein
MSKEQRSRIRPALRLVAILAATIAMVGGCGGSRSTSSPPSKAYTEAADMARALDCSTTFTSQQRFPEYNNGYCSYNGHQTDLFACSTSDVCRTIANNVTAVATAPETKQWVVGNNWMVAVEEADVPLALKALGGGEVYTPVTPTN